jgi:nucleotide-binding universal stress UspA family protein
VVVGVDGSPVSRAALRVAAWEARARGTALEIVLAFPWRPDDRVPAPAGFDGRAVLHAAAEIALDGMAAAAREQQRGLHVTARPVVGRPVDVLADESASAQLICVGSRSTGTVTDLLLGSTAAALVQLSACPVLVVPWSPGWESDRGPVVVGLDGGDGDLQVATVAFDAAALRRCGLTAVHAPVHTPGLVGSRADGGTAGRRAAEAVSDVLRAVGARRPGVPVRPVVTGSSAARLLLAASEDAQLVVVGHRHRRFGRLGSVASAVLHRARCPVTVVPLALRSDPGGTAIQAEIASPLRSP